MRTHVILSSIRGRPEPRRHVLNDCGHPVTPPLVSSNALYAIGQLLWIDAYDGGPWIPSHIDKVVLERSSGVIEYQRGDTDE